MSLRFDEIRLEDGSVRFLDRTTEPAFSEDMSKMDLKVTGSGTSPASARNSSSPAPSPPTALSTSARSGRRGAPLYLDLGGRDPRPQAARRQSYADQTLAWLIRQGSLQYKFNLKVENDQVTSMNEVVVQKLRVAKSTRPDDQVKSRLGMPLGLIVALIKDGGRQHRGEGPGGGLLQGSKWDLSETIWRRSRMSSQRAESALQADRRLFSSEDKLEEPKVDPVTFPPGRHGAHAQHGAASPAGGGLQRQTPYVTLTTHPVVVRADVEALKSAEVAARLQQFAKEKGIGDPPKILAAYFKRSCRMRSRRRPSRSSCNCSASASPCPKPRSRRCRSSASPSPRSGSQERRHPGQALPAGEPKKPGDGAAEGRVEFSIDAGEEE